MGETKPFKRSFGKRRGGLPNIQLSMLLLCQHLGELQLPEKLVNEAQSRFPDLNCLRIFSFGFMTWTQLNL